MLESQSKTKVHNFSENFKIKIKLKVALITMYTYMKGVCILPMVYTVQSYPSITIYLNILMHT